MIGTDRSADGVVLTWKVSGKEFFSENELWRPLN